MTSLPSTKSPVKGVRKRVNEGDEGDEGEGEGESGDEGDEGDEGEREGDVANTPSARSVFARETARACDVIIVLAIIHSEIEQM